MLYAALLSVLLANSSDSSNPFNDKAAAGMFAGFMVIYALFFLAILVLSIVVNWKIAQKAGYQGALSLLMLIPLVNFVILLIFAFSEWPVEAEVKRLRAAPNAALPSGVAPSGPALRTGP